MCVVSYINTDGCFYLTSNRDIPKDREIAIPPQSYIINDQILFFPKDPNAGGSWIATNAERLGCILNVKNKRLLKKNNSRGIFMIECLTQYKPEDYFKSYDLSNTYPFSMILIDITKKSLQQLIWDGDKKDIKTLNIKQNYLWMSSSIYNQNIIDTKKNLFNDILNTQFNKKDILNFHIENKFNPSMNNKINTANITQISGSLDIENLDYFNLLDNKSKSISIKEKLLVK